MVSEAAIFYVQLQKKLYDEMPQLLLFLGNSLRVRYRQEINFLFLKVWKHKHCTEMMLMQIL